MQNCNARKAVLLLQQTGPNLTLKMNWLKEKTVPVILRSSKWIKALLQNIENRVKCVCWITYFVLQKYTQFV